MSRCAKDYPEHLNPFDENYDGVVAAEPANNRQKYNTWSSRDVHKVSAVVKQKPTFLEKPWVALNISPKNKIVRRLSILKSTVEKFATKNKRLTHSSSYTEGSLPHRSHSVHDDFAFRIISPKLKEKIRQQAFSTSLIKQETTESDSVEKPNSPQLNGRLTVPSKLEDFEKNEDISPSSPQQENKFNTLGARPKARKKRPPPPPPTDTLKSCALKISNGEERTEDSHSANSSITQDLEKDASSEEDNSLTDLEHQHVKLESKND